jgi:hypothetical protein
MMFTTSLETIFVADMTFSTIAKFAVEWRRDLKVT